MRHKTALIPFSVVLILFLFMAVSQTLIAAPAPVVESNIVVRAVLEDDLPLFVGDSRFKVFQSCYVNLIDNVAQEFWVMASAQDFAPPDRRSSRSHTANDKAVVGLTDDQLRKKHVRLADQTLPVLVKSYLGFSQTYVERRLADMTNRNQVLTVSRWGAHTWAIRVKENALNTLYAENWLEHVEPGPYPAKRSGHLQVTKTDLAQHLDTSTTPPSYLLSGQAGAPDDEIRLGIADGGIFHAHQEFTPRSLYACECEPLPDEDLFEGCPKEGNEPSCTNGSCDIPDTVQCSYTEHATFMGHIAAGDGGPSTSGGYDLRGQAPNARLGDYPTHWNREELAAKALNIQATDISIHPYESSPLDDYTALDAKMDRLIRGAATYEGTPIPARPQIWSAGTECGAKVRSTNKNGIVIGVYDIEDWCTEPGQESKGDSYGTGPTKDGRVKPDFVLPGIENVQVAVVGDTCCLGNKYDPQDRLGTSEAAGIVGGITALIIEALAPERSGFEYPATYKAVFAQSADDVGVLGPERKSGFGVIDAQAATTIAAGNNHWAEGIVAPNKKHKYCITESIDNTRVRTALAWDDKETCATTTSRLGGVLTNDLDLRVTGPGTTEYAITPPNIILPIPFRPGDHTNNVEIIDFATSSAGNPWTIEVRGTNLEGDQSYGIASSHHIEFCGEEEISLFQPPVLASQLIASSLFKRPVDLDELCPYVLECSICQDGPFGLCPAFTTTLRNLPEGTQVSLLDAKGSSVNQSTEHRGRHELSIPTRLKTRKLFLKVKAPNPNTLFQVRLTPRRSRTN